MRFSGDGKAGGLMIPTAKVVRGLVGAIRAGLASLKVRNAAVGDDDPDRGRRGQVILGITRVGEAHEPAENLYQQRLKPAVTLADMAAPGARRAPRPSDGPVACPRSPPASFWRSSAERPSWTPSTNPPPAERLRKAYAEHDGWRPRAPGAFRRFRQRKTPDRRRPASGAREAPGAGVLKTPANSSLAGDQLNASRLPPRAVRKLQEPGPAGRCPEPAGGGDLPRDGDDDHRRCGDCGGALVRSWFLVPVRRRPAVTAIAALEQIAQGNFRRRSISAGVTSSGWCSTG